MLIRTNMEDLRDQTQTKHYELYRKVYYTNQALRTMKGILHKPSTTNYIEGYIPRCRVLSQRPFPKRQFPNVIFPSCNFPYLQFFKSVLGTALGPLAFSIRNARPHLQPTEEIYNLFGQ